MLLTRSTCAAVGRRGRSRSDRDSSSAPVLSTSAASRSTATAVAASARDPAEKRAVPSRCPPTCPVFVGDRATSGQGLVGEQRLLNPTEPDELDRQEQLASTRECQVGHL